MKPDWKDAPEWARYVAMDSDGRWAWHEEKPHMYSGLWESRARVRYVEFQEPPEWRDSLERRP